MTYNAAMAAYKAKNWDKAVKYFDKSIENRYNGAISVNYIFEAYEAKGDTLNAIISLRKGFEKYPKDETLIKQLIKFYLQTNNPSEAINYLNLAIDLDSTNASYYILKGSTLENSGNKEEALDAYKLAIKMDNTRFNPYYNIGVIYFNKGVAGLNEATGLPSDATAQYDAKIEEGLSKLREALPYFEKAYAINPKQTAILGSLKLIYYRLQMLDKYNEINEKIKNVSR